MASVQVDTEGVRQEAEQLLQRGETLVRAGQTIQDLCSEIDRLREPSPHLSELASLLRVVWRKNGDLVEGACWEIRRLRELCERSQSRSERCADRIRQLATALGGEEHAAIVLAQLDVVS